MIKNIIYKGKPYLLSNNSLSRLHKVGNKFSITYGFVISIFYLLHCNMWALRYYKRKQLLTNNSSHWGLFFFLVSLILRTLLTYGFVGKQFMANNHIRKQLLSSTTISEKSHQNTYGNHLWQPLEDNELWSMIDWWVRLHVQDKKIAHTWLILKYQFFLAISFNVVSLTVHNEHGFNVVTVMSCGQCITVI
jgi:hypothetical protein